MSALKPISWHIINVVLAVCIEFNFFVFFFMIFKNESKFLFGDERSGNLFIDNDDYKEYLFPWVMMNWQCPDNEEKEEDKNRNYFDLHEFFLFYYYFVISSVDSPTCEKKRMRTAALDLPRLASKKIATNEKNRK